ncbi:MAG: hypothetical protein ACLU5J_03735 [Christensenellales bacterium]
MSREINYPSGNGFDGYRRPFYSYLEGINAASPNPSISINQTISRCNAKRDGFTLCWQCIILSL